ANDKLGGGPSASLCPTKESPMNQIYELLTKGHTMAEMVEKLRMEEDQIQAVLDEPQEGHDLFIQRNAFNEKVYIYLPTLQTRRPPKKPVFKRYVAKNTPWVVIQFPNTFKAKRLDLVPLYDVHYGHKSCNLEKFREYVEY